MPHPSAARKSGQTGATRRWLRKFESNKMDHSDNAIAVYTTHADAEAAIAKLASAGFAMQDLGLIGKGFHTEEQVIGFYNNGDRVRFWGARGAFWGGMWGLFFGGLFVTVPVMGPVVVLGYLAAAALSAIEGAVVVGGLSALSAALYGLGIPKDTVLAYEAAVKADGYLVMARGNATEVARAKILLGLSTQASITTEGAPAVEK